MNFQKMVDIFWKSWYRPVERELLEIMSKYDYSETRRYISAIRGMINEMPGDVDDARAEELIEEYVFSRERRPAAPMRRITG